MADELLERYFGLTDREREEFNRKFWMIAPNNSEHCTHRINHSTQTESGDIYYGNGVYYLSHHKYGIESTGYYILSWFLPGNIENFDGYERKNQVALF